MRRQYTSLKYENTLQNHEYRDDNPEEKEWKWDLVWKHRRNIFENKNMSSKSIVKNEFFQRQGGIFSFLPEKKSYLNQIFPFLNFLMCRVMNGSHVQ